MMDWIQDLAIWIKLDLLQDYMNKREDVVREMDEAHTTTANENQPCIICM